MQMHLFMQAVACKLLKLLQIIQPFMFMFCICRRLANKIICSSFLKMVFDKVSSWWRRLIIADIRCYFGTANINYVYRRKIIFMSCSHEFNYLTKIIQRSHFVNCSMYKKCLFSLMSKIHGWWAAAVNDEQKAKFARSAQKFWISFGVARITVITISDDWPREQKKR